MRKVELLEAPKEPNDLALIVKNVSRMRQEKGQLEARQTAILRAMKKVESRLAGSDDFEEVENLQEIVDNLCSISSDLEMFRSHLETELDKVKRGVAVLETLRGKQGRRAFAAYVREDTELSIKNLGHVRSYYDQVIETIKQLNDEPLNY